MNPILPLQYFIPDVEAHTWSDGRLYCYGSQDIGGNFGYCSHAYRVFSTDNMVDWQDHGESFSTLGPEAQTPWSSHELYAPDCVCKDGTYYLYFCQKDKGEGVAVSDRPEGPFREATTIPGPHLDAIDPAAFVDDDGQAYLYWGQFNCRGARLTPDMRHIDEATLDPCLIDEKRHGFHEGACMRKRGDTYYLIYCDISRGRATCLSYATSDSPLGPFTKGGTIIDNDGADPENWNNHGSIMEFQGQWYIFYHRSSQASRYNRRVCVEPIFFDENGHIAEVEMTTQGAEGPIPATTELAATRACLLHGTLRSELAGEPGDEHLARIKPGDGAVYKYLRFSPALARFRATVATATHGGIIEVRLDGDDGPLIGRCEIPCTGGWRTWQEATCPIEPTSGVHALHLRFVQRAGDQSNLQIGNLASFAFA
jgi:hypothetical protein